MQKGLPFLMAALTRILFIKALFCNKVLISHMEGGFGMANKMARTISAFTQDKVLYPNAKGVIVSVTSRNTGCTLVRLCRTMSEAEAFIDAASPVVDDNGECFWSTTKVSNLIEFVPLNQVIGGRK